MGLAASQARFLAITARKADCEFRSMQNAQEKLSITRELAEASASYQEAMNQTKLVWDLDGSGTLTYGLNYGILMTPSELNDYSPNLVTTRTGAIVLSSKYATAAEAAGIDKSGGIRSDVGFIAFMEALHENGVVAESTKNNIVDFINNGNYQINAGYGDTPMCKDEVYAKNKSGLAYQLRNTVLFSNNENFTSNKSASGYKILVGSDIKNSASISKLNFGDLLRTDIRYICTTSSNNDTSKEEEFYNNVTTILKSFHSEMQDILGVDSLSIEALETAYLQTRTMYSSNNKATTSGIKETIDTYNSACSKAKEYNSIVYADTDRGKQKDTLGVDLSNMISVYLTYFELALNGYNSSYNVATKSDVSLFVTNNPNYEYVMNNKDNENNVDIKKADFYMQLYNNICNKGYIENSSVEKEDKHLENSLKNGTYFLASLSPDGYFYQNRYNDTYHVEEIKDEDAIARAEAEFNAMKTKLTYKEEKIDIEMKNIDLELSALTTEYDSVKQMITNNVQKIFSQFQ